MNDTVIYQFDQGVAQVTINRPDKKNALSKEVFQGLIDIGEAIKGDRQVRAVVLSGAGHCFSAGIDLSLVSDALEPNMLPPRTHGITNFFQHSAWVWHQVPVPVIAAVEGICFGGGLQIACGADMRYVHPSAKLSIMEIKWGLVPDLGGTQLWSHFVKQDLLRELSYTGEIFDGKQAMEYGFCTRLTDNPLQMALETAHTIAGKSPDAIRANKRLINDQHRIGEIEGLLAESIEQDQLASSPNQAEAVAAVMQKRAPQFVDGQ